MNLFGPLTLAIVCGSVVELSRISGRLGPGRKLDQVYISKYGFGSDVSDC